MAPLDKRIAPMRYFWTLMTCLHHNRAPLESVSQCPATQLDSVWDEHWLCRLAYEDRTVVALVAEDYHA